MNNTTCPFCGGNLTPNYNGDAPFQDGICDNCGMLTPQFKSNDEYIEYIDKRFVEEYLSDRIEKLERGETVNWSIVEENIKQAARIRKLEMALREASLSLQSIWLGRASDINDPWEIRAYADSRHVVAIAALIKDTTEIKV